MRTPRLCEIFIKLVFYPNHPLPPKNAPTPDIADGFNVDYRYSHNCTIENFDAISKSIETIAKNVDYIYITIDMDGFSSAYAPGVSAPSPMGLEPIFVQRCLDLLKATKKVIALDIAELNPKYDRDNCTAKLAARLIDSWIGK